MSLICTGNRIQLTDVDARVAFDTNREMFHTLNFVTGTKTIAARSNVNTSQDINTTTFIANINAACTHLFGWMQPVFTGGQDAGIADQKWAQIGGTVMMFLSPGDRFNTEYRFANTTGSTFTHAYGLTFIISAAQILLSEQCFFMRINSGDVGAGDIQGMLGFDLNYKIWAGKFT